MAQDSKGMSAKGRLHSDLSSTPQIRFACSAYLTDTAHIAPTAVLFPLGGINRPPCPVGLLTSSGIHQYIRIAQGVRGCLATVGEGRQCCTGGGESRVGKSPCSQGWERERCCWEPLRRHNFNDSWRRLFGGRGTAGCSGTESGPQLQLPA